MRRLPTTGARTGAPVLLLLLGPAWVLAQAVAPSSEALTRCASLPEDGERLACFDRLTRGAPSEGRTGAQTPAPTRGPDDPPEVTPPPEPSSGVASGARAGAGTPDIPVAAEDAHPMPESEPGPDPDEAGDALGERYVREPEPAPERPEVVIRRVVKVESGYRRPLLFYFENGQVWRQMSPERFVYPRGRPFDGHIRQGMMGDFQLRVEGRGPMTRIVRVR